MKSTADFRRYFDTKLVKELDELEHARSALEAKLKKARNFIAITALTVAAGLVAIVPHYLIGLIPIVIIALIVYAAMKHSMSKDYRKQFKQEVIGKIINFIEEKINYLPADFISRSEFSNSGIFLEGIDRYKGDDLFHGSIDKTEIEFSEVHAEYKTTTTDSKGRKTTHWHTIFKGIFFKADFNKHFQGRTVVLTDTAEKILGRFGKKLQSMSFGRADLVNLEDPEFEKEFVVYGTDQVEARYILSTALMERITKYKELTGRAIQLSFAHSSVYIAIPFGKDLFEPKLFDSLHDFEVLDEYFQTLSLTLSLVEALNLNRRIWGKS